MIFICSKEDIAIVEYSINFFQVVVYQVNEHDEDLIFLIIQLILYAISNKSFQTDIMESVSQKLTQHFQQFSSKVVYRKGKQVAKEVQVSML